MFAVALTLIAVAPTAAAPADAAEVRAALERSVPYLETAGDRWVEQKDCVSCHRVGNQLWALGAAAQVGMPGDGRFEERAAWSLDSVLAEAKDGGVAGSANREGVAQLLLAPGAARDEDERAALVALLRDGQRDDGGWDAGGQLPMQKRPKPETDVASALWIVLALQGEQADDPAIERALAFADAAPSPISVEPLAGRLLIADRRGDAATRDRLTAELRNWQHADGGWGWLRGDDSDALGTGLALFALLESGVPPEDSAALAARRFLVESQQADGSWPVHGTKANRKDKVMETASYWGAAWATTALARSLADDG